MMCVFLVSSRGIQFLKRLDYTLPQRKGGLELLKESENSLCSLVTDCVWMISKHAQTARIKMTMSGIYLTFC